MAPRPLNLLLVDGDPIFRLGLEAALGKKPGVRAIAGVEDLAAAAQLLEQQRVAGLLPPDVVILNVAFAVESLGLEGAAQAIERFQREQPDLPLLGLEHQHPASLGLWCRRQPMAGYWSRSRSLDEFVEALMQLRRGYEVWTLPERPRVPLVPQQIPRLGFWSGQVASGMVQVDAQLYALERQREQASWVEKIWLDGAQRELRATRWLLKQFSGRADRALTEVAESQAWELEAGSSVPLKNPWEDTGGDIGDRLANAGSIAAVGGLVGSGSQNISLSQSFLSQPSLSQPSESERNGQSVNADSNPNDPSSSLTSATDSAPVTARAKSIGRELQALLFEQISLRMPPGLVNLTGDPQEIDILNPQKRQELLSVVLRCWGDLLTDLRLSNLEPEQLMARRSPLLVDWWTAALGDFLGKYSSLVMPGGANPGLAGSGMSSDSALVGAVNNTLNNSLMGGSVEVMPILLREQPVVESAIFNHIPGVEMLFSTLLFGTPVAIDGVDYRPESPEAMMRLVLLSENLLVQMANGVVQPLLNNFADVDVIKQSFYDKRLLSTREIEKFRNNLSWKYRVGALFQEAQEVYESRYGLLYFSKPLEEGGRGGISKTSVYAPRRTEMARLNSFQQVVTLALEVRDAVAPRLEVVTRWAGTAVVYVLTQVVGRGIGLIGRGVVQGVGSSMQDIRNLRK